MGLGIRHRQPEALLGAPRGRRDLRHLHPERRAKRIGSAASAALSADLAGRWPRPSAPGRSAGAGSSWAIGARSSPISASPGTRPSGWRSAPRRIAPRRAGGAARTRRARCRLKHSELRTATRVVPRRRPHLSFGARFGICSRAKLLSPRGLDNANVGHRARRRRSRRTRRPPRLPQPDPAGAAGPAGRLAHGARSSATPVPSRVRASRSSSATTSTPASSRSSASTATTR